MSKGGRYANYRNTFKKKKKRERGWDFWLLQELSYWIPFCCFPKYIVSYLRRKSIVPATNGLLSLPLFFQTVWKCLKCLQTVWKQMLFSLAEPQILCRGKIWHAETYQGLQTSQTGKGKAPSIVWGRRGRPEAILSFISHSPWGNELSKVYRLHLAGKGGAASFFTKKAWFWPETKSLRTGTTRGPIRASHWVGLDYLFCPVCVGGWEVGLWD